MRPNAPRMVTVVVAVALMVIGLVLVFYQGQALDLVRAIGLPADIQHQIVTWVGDKVVAWVALAASPILLIVGSLLPNI